MKNVCILFLFVTCLTVQANAWGNKGHEVVAYIAYQHLDAATREQVDDLVARNPCYTEWQDAVQALPAGERQVGLFMLAATWPDKIKQSQFSPTYDCQPGLKFIQDGGIPPGGDRISKDYPPDTPEASQNIGYGDTRRHQYWHFIDNPFSTDGTPVEPASTPNALTELMKLSNALHTDEGDDLKSYDMVWVEHLVGDLHQPLHDSSRFTSNHPNGDAGGNLVATCDTAGCKDELHGFWDGLPGPGNDLPAAIKLGRELDSQAAPNDDEINVEDPAAWSSEGFRLAKTVAYASPVTSDSLGSSPQTLNKTYRDNARDTMKKQLFIAGHRLAAILNNYLE